MLCLLPLKGTFTPKISQWSLRKTTSKEKEWGDTEREEKINERRLQERENVELSPFLTNYTPCHYGESQEHMENILCILHICVCLYLYLLLKCKLCEEGRATFIHYHIPTTLQSTCYRVSAFLKKRFFICSHCYLRNYRFVNISLKALVWLILSN